MTRASIPLVTFLLWSASARGAVGPSLERQLWDAQQQPFRPSAAGFQWLVFAQAAFGLSHQGAMGLPSGAIGAEISYSGPRCRYVAGGGQLRLFADADGPALSGAQRLSGCLALGATTYTLIELSHQLEYNALPSLSARRVLLRRRYIAETLFVDWRSVGLPVGEHELVFFAATPAVTLLWQGERVREQFLLSGDVAMVRVVRSRGGPPLPSRLEVDVLPLHVEGTARNFSLSVLELMPARVRGIPLGGRRLQLDADLGVGLGAIHERGGTEEEPAPALLDRQILTAHAALRAELDRLSLRLGFARSLWPTIFDELVLESRARSGFRCCAAPWTSACRATWPTARSRRWTAARSAT